MALGLFVAGLLDLLDGPHQRLNGTLQIFRVHLVRFVARKVDADQLDIASIAEAVGSIASDVGSNRSLPNSQLPIGASYRKVIAGISRFATCGPRGPNENALRQRTFVVLPSRRRRTARACPLWMAPASAATSSPSGIEMPGSLAAARLIASSEPRVWGPDQNFALAKRRVATLLADVGESRFENVTDWLPRASVELKKSQIFDRPKARRSSADFDPR